MSKSQYPKESRVELVHKLGWRLVPKHYVALVLVAVGIEFGTRMWSVRNTCSRDCGRRMQASWRNTIIAESDQTFIVEGAYYFPPDSIKSELLEPSTHTKHCHWKGLANYYNIRVGQFRGDVNGNCAWTYKDPKPGAEEIKDYVAFWKGVKVLDLDTEYSNGPKILFYAD